MKRLFLVPVLSTLFSTSSFAYDCPAVRAAMDLGSSTFKIKVALVDHCAQKVERELFTDSVKVGLSDSIIPPTDRATLPRGKKGPMSNEAMDRGAAVIEKWMTQAREHGATEFLAVGTQVFRDATNTDTFISKLPSELKVRMLTNQQEGILGYATAATAVGDSKIVAWDIGGKSMQITHRGETSRQFTYYLGTEIASNSTRDLIKKLFNQNGSPNPVAGYYRDQNNAPASKIPLIKTTLFEKIRQETTLHSLLAPLRTSRVIGIGGVHAQSILGQLRKLGLIAADAKKYNIYDISRAIDLQSTKTDAELESKYADTEVTNLLMVYAFMDFAGVDAVEVADVNLADGLLVSGFELL